MSPVPSAARERNTMLLQLIVAAWAQDKSCSPAVFPEQVCWTQCPSILLKTVSQLYLTEERNIQRTVKQDKGTHRRWKM